MGVSVSVHSPILHVKFVAGTFAQPDHFRVHEAPPMEEVAMGILGVMSSGWVRFARPIIMVVTYSGRPPVPPADD